MQLTWKCDICFTCGYWKVFAAWRHWICSTPRQICAAIKERKEIRIRQESQNVL